VRHTQSAANWLNMSVLSCYVKKEALAIMSGSLRQTG
jgi:hypothetical protein